MTDLTQQLAELRTEHQAEIELMNLCRDKAKKLAKRILEVNRELSKEQARKLRGVGRG